MVRRLHTLLLGSSLRRRLVSGAFWSICSSVFLRLTGFVNVIVLTRVFSAEQYGAYGLILNTLGMFGLVGGFEMGLTATKYVAEHRHRNPDRAGRVIGLGLVVTAVTATLMAGLLFGGSTVIAVHAFGEGSLSGEIRLAALLMLLTALTSVLFGVLAGLEAFSVAAALQMGMAVLTTVAVCIGGWWGGIAGALYGSILASGVNLGASLGVVRSWCRRWGIRVRFEDLEWSLVSRFGLPAVLRSIVSTPSVWLVRALMTREPDGLAQLGLFTAAWQWFALVMMIPEFWTRALVPVLSERLGAGAHHQFRRVILATCAFNLFVVVAFSSLVFLLSDYVLLLYGRDLRFSQELLLLALATGTLCAASAPIGSALTATGTMWGATALNATWGVALVLLALPMGRSPEGLATAYLVAYVIHVVTTGLLLWYVLHRNAARASSALEPPLHAHPVR
jgi:O-antigen/teichoic acid export membrane protein